MTIAEIGPTIAEAVEFDTHELLARGRSRGTVLLRTERLSPTLVRVSAGGESVGFLELAGGVWVALYGPVYGWATEVGQNLDPDLAVLALFTNGCRPAGPTGLPRGSGPVKL